MGEEEAKPVCACARCGRTLREATRDSPCPACGSSFFTVRYEKAVRRLPKP